MRKFLLLLSLSLASITCNVLLLNMGVHAVGYVSEIRWDTEGNEPDLLWRDEFWERYGGDAAKSYDDASERPDSIRFRLVSESRDNYRFTNADPINIKIPMGSNGAGADVSCVISKLRLDVDIRTNPDRVTELKVDGDDGVSMLQEGGSILGVPTDGLGNVLGNKLGLCKSAFNDKDGSAFGWGDGQGGGVFKNEQHDIINQFGEDANITALLTQLDKMRIREQTHFSDRVCGVNSREGDSEKCRYETDSYYDKIWASCQEDAKAETDKEKRVEQLQKCVEEKSGVAINGTLLNETVFHEITYADGPSCSIQYIGWIVCPVSRFLAQVTDIAFKYLQRFFEISPLTRGQPAGDALYSGWQLVLRFANLMFVAVFILIIMSQVTGRGLEKYGVKALFPRLIVAAVCVNVSYYLCVIAVDFSNLLGNGIFELFRLLEPRGYTNQLSDWQNETESLLIFTTATVGAGFVLLSASLVALIPLLVGAALSFIVALIMIIARYAIILIMIMIAPFAIACVLLPGTRKWWTQWFKLFTSVLMLYPLVALVFGASHVAAIVILNSNVPRSEGGTVTLQVFSLAIQALPLALTPLLMRLSNNIVSGIGNKVAGSKLVGKAREGADGWAQGKKNARDVKALNATGSRRRFTPAGLRDYAIQRKYRRKAKQSYVQSDYNNALQNYTSRYIAGEEPTLRGRATQAANLFRDDENKKDVRYHDGDKFAQQLAKGGGNVDIVKSDALKAQLAINTDIVKAAKDKLNHEHGGDMDAIAKVASGEAGAASEEVRQAAIELVLSGGTLDQVNAVVKSSAGMSKRQRQVTASGVSSRRVISQGAYYDNPEAQRAILNGDVSDDDSFTQHVVASSINGNYLSASEIGSMHTSGLQEVHKALGSGAVSSASGAAVSNAARRALASSDIRSTMHGDGSVLEDIANHRR